MCGSEKLGHTQRGPCGYSAEYPAHVSKGPAGGWRLGEEPARRVTGPTARCSDRARNRDRSHRPSRRPSRSDTQKALPRPGDARAAIAFGPRGTARTTSLHRSGRGRSTPSLERPCPSAHRKETHGSRVRGPAGRVNLLCVVAFLIISERALSTYEKKVSCNTASRVAAASHISCSPCRSTALFPPAADSVARCFVQRRATQARSPGARR